MAKLQHDILCILGAPTPDQIPLSQTPTHIIQFIEFTYCHDQFPETIIKTKYNRYDPLIDILQQKGWKVNPLITIPGGMRGAFHEKLQVCS